MVLAVGNSKCLCCLEKHHHNLTPWLGQAVSYYETDTCYCPCKCHYEDWWNVFWTLTHASILILYIYVCVCVRACVYYMPYTFQIFSVCHSLLMSFASAASSAHIVFRSECKRRCLPSQWEWQRAYRCEGYLGVPAAKKMRKVPGKKNEGRHMPCITANMCQSHRAFQALSFREKYLS